MKINSIKLKAKIDNIFGICCYHLLPIEQEYYMGKGKIIAICTLASLDLLKEIKNNNEIMEKISIVGRLLSENKGIDEIINFTKKNTLLKYILVCGEDVKGHLPGQTLISLKENGIDINKKIMKSSGAYPFLTGSTQDVESFRNQVNIINKKGLKDINKIKDIVLNLNYLR
ncbi:MAG: tetrahydromethanopterin S-methyltransferase subunit A [Nitrososphaeraceae archaeon]